MKTATLSEAIDIMRNGNHCLWVGAGCTKQLVGPSYGPSWIELVEKLENESRISPSSASYPIRLEQCQANLGKPRFRQVVREQLHDRIYRKLFDLALEDHANGSTNVPASVKKLVHLGAIGNPIVSFNIESASAIALSVATKPTLAKTYVGGAKRTLAYQLDTIQPKQLARKVLFPHGCLEMADCVLTDGEYTAHKSSMIFQLATHQAYASALFIVG